MHSICRTNEYPQLPYRRPDLRMFWRRQHPAATRYRSKFASGWIDCHGSHHHHSRNRECSAKLCHRQCRREPHHTQNLQISPDGAFIFSGSYTYANAGFQQLSGIAIAYTNGISTQQTVSFNIIPTPPPDCSQSGAFCALLSGNSIPSANTPALGCQVKSNYVVCQTSSGVGSGASGSSGVAIPPPPAGGYFIQSATLKFGLPSTNCPTGLTCYSFSGSTPPSGCIQFGSTAIACGAQVGRLNLPFYLPPQFPVGLDDFQITGQIDPNVSFDRSSDTVTISIGTFSQAIPMSLFSVSGQVFSYANSSGSSSIVGFPPSPSPQNPGIASSLA